MWKPSDGYDPKAQRDARPSKAPDPTPISFLRLLEAQLGPVANATSTLSFASLAATDSVSIGPTMCTVADVRLIQLARREIRNEIKRREQ